MNKWIKYSTPFALTAFIMLLIFAWKSYYIKQNTTELTITFQIDMREELKKGHPMQTVALRGSNAPLDWFKDQPLADTNEDGIYETTLVVENPKYLEYKFVITGTETEWEEGDNRTLPPYPEGQNLNVMHQWNKK